MRLDFLDLMSLVLFALGGTVVAACGDGSGATKGGQPSIGGNDGSGRAGADTAGRSDDPTSGGGGDGGQPAPVASGGASQPSEGGATPAAGHPGTGGVETDATGGTNTGGHETPLTTGGVQATGGATETPSGGAPATGGETSASTGGVEATGGSSAGPDPESTGGSGPGPTPPEGIGYLHVQGSQLLDDAGNVVRMTGVNWFGFETSNLSPHGLWTRDYRSMMKQIADVGFNTVRLPWCDAMLREGAETRSINTDGADAYDGTEPMNAPLLGLSPIEVMDLVIAAAGEVGLRVMLDNHSREPDGYMEEHVWYTDETSEAQWIENWRFMASRYLGNPTVVAFDLDNEPHAEATWGAGDPATDWNSAAERCGNAILEVNPDVLIVVEGVEKVGTDGYWWGGNLSGARDLPINLSNPAKLVYSAHEYGPEVHVQPWFESAEFPGNLQGIWDSHFGFLMNESLGHVFIGEIGIKDPEAFEGKSNVWFQTFLEYMGPSYSWTFWCWNPNSGDTEGILDYDWLTPKQWKLDAISQYLAPRI